MVLTPWISTKRTMVLVVTVCNVLGLEEGKECIIVGTLHKHMKLKPSILDEYSKEVRTLLINV